MRTLRVLRSQLLAGDSLFSRAARRGQTVLLMILILGSILLGATVVAGLLIVFQLRQTVDLGTSTKAVFAADAGTEWALFAYFCEDEGRCPVFPLPPTFSNNSVVDVICYDNADAEVGCGDQTMNKIRSTGSTKNSARTFEVCFNRQCDI